MIGIGYKRMIMIDKHIIKHEIGCNNKLRCPKPIRES